MAGESLNDKQHAAYTAHAGDFPPGAVRVVGEVTTIGGTAPTVNFPVIQPVSVTSGFPIVQPVSITSGFPVTQPVSVADGADITQGSTADAPWVAGDGTVISLLKKVASAGGGAVSIADGADIVEGSTADAAVITDASGTVSGKLRGLVKIWADIWDPTNHWIKILVGGSSITQPVSITSGFAALTPSIQPVSISSGFPTQLPVSVSTGVITTVNMATVNMTQIATGTVVLATTGVQKVGISGANAATFDAAIGAALPGNAILTAFRTATLNPSPSTDALMVAPMSDKVGRQVVTVGHVRNLVVSTHMIVKGSTANQTIIAAGGAGVFHDLASLTITTTFTTIGTLSINDGTATAIFLNYPNANLAPGAPCVLFFQPPIPQTTANSNWRVTQSSSTMAVNYNAVFIKNV